MSSDSRDARKLMYQPYSSIINPGFWQQLTELKLNKLKLSQDPVTINGSYSCNLSETLPSLASFDHSSFSEGTISSDRASCQLNGQVTCFNIMQEFLDYDKKKFLETNGDSIWQTILDGRALYDPEKYLSKFGLLVFADLKKYKFFYWFAFPTLNYPKDVYLSKLNANDSTSRPILDFFSEDAVRSMQLDYDKPSSQRTFQRGYFIVKHYVNKADGSDGVLTYPLKDYEIAKESSSNHRDETIYFAFSDPSANALYPGWPLRNLLCLIAVHYQLDKVKVIRIRKGPPSTISKLDMHHCSILELTYQLDPYHGITQDLNKRSSLPTPSTTGWEKNESQQLRPKIVNLSNLLDPRMLADNAVNLNLKLMKWRLLPNLDLDRISQTKCLILGCGTLGCHVSRCLLAWGVKNLSIVDNAVISYSNPVRQTLYSFDDCIKSQGSFKALAAADSLRKIHPMVNVNAHVFSIPMPGHHIAGMQIEQTKQDVAKLENLIEEHDVIFLLMDTRESRWLPTVIAKSRQKLVINAAIGFDTFLLQRYGIRDYSVPLCEDEAPFELENLNESGQSSAKNPQQLPSNKLGCYFCNDIVAPGDSTLDRTLDQQCTVSRPGVSMMVSAMAVELMVSIVSSRLGANTPAPMEIQNDLSLSNEEEWGSELGIVPHSLRGNLARYFLYMPTSPSFNKCAACSSPVINAYRTSGFEFLLKVFDDSSLLEEITGLKDLQNVDDNVWALGSDEEAEDLDS